MLLIIGIEPTVYALECHLNDLQYLSVVKGVEVHVSARLLPEHFPSLAEA